MQGNSGPELFKCFGVWWSLPLPTDEGLQHPGHFPCLSEETSMCIKLAGGAKSKFKTCRAKTLYVFNFSVNQCHAMLHYQYFRDLSECARDNGVNE